MMSLLKFLILFWPPRESLQGKGTSQSSLGHISFFGFVCTNHITGNGIDKSVYGLDYWLRFLEGRITLSTG